MEVHSHNETNMANILKTLSGSQPWVHISIEDVDVELRLKAASLKESLSQPSHGTIEFASPHPNLSSNDMLGRPATVTLDGTTDHPGRHYHGHISAISQTGQDRNYSHYEISVESSLAFMDKRSNVRIYQNQNEIQIIKSLLDEHQISDVAINLMGKYEARDYIVQYNESDLDFIHRLMSEAGIYYHHSHTEQSHTLNIQDHPSAHTGIQQTDIAYSSATGQLHDEGIISHIQRQHCVKTDTASVNDYQFKKPGLSLYSEKKTQQGASGLEAYNYPGTHHSPETGNTQARNRNEAETHDQRHIKGTGTTKSLTAGYTFTLAHHPNTEANTSYLITESEHSIKQPQVLGEEASDTHNDEYSNSFKAIEADKQYRTAPIDKPTVNGVQTAIVTGPEGEEIYVDEHNRVKVQFHWDRQGQYNEKSSCWIRVGQSWAGNGFGAVAIPRIGQEVIVDFINGDPDRPIITGSVYHGSNRPPYDLPANKTRTVFKTDTHKGEGYNEIRIEDEREQEEIYIHAQKDQNNVVNNDETTSVGHDRTEDVGNDEQQTIGHDRTISTGNDETRIIGNDQRTTITRDNLIQIDRNRQISIEKDLIETVNNHKKQTTFADHSRETGGHYEHKVKGKITRQSVDSISLHTTDFKDISAEKIILKGRGGTITVDSSGIRLKANRISIKSPAVSFGPGKKNAIDKFKEAKNTGEPFCIPCAFKTVSGKNTSKFPSPAPAATQVVIPTTNDDDTTFWPVPGYTNLNVKDKAGEGDGAFNANRGSAAHRRYHKGIDIQAPVGARVVAFKSGKVVTYANTPRKSTSYGYQVIIDHGDGVFSQSAHLSKIEPGIKAGVKVAGGQTIGYIGRTGNTPVTGDSHMHYEIRIGIGAARGKVDDPLKYLPRDRK